MSASNDDDTNPWQTHSVHTVYDNPWISISHRTVTTPNNTPGIYGLVHMKNLAVGVVPIDTDDHTWLVGQYRYPTDHYSWEIPEGGCAPGEDPVAAAKRELLEECGLHAARCELIFETELSNSVTDERGKIFVATELSPGQAAPDDTELLAVRRLPLAEAIAMVRRGEITDSLSQLALLTLAGAAPTP